MIILLFMFLSAADGGTFDFRYDKVRKSSPVVWQAFDVGKSVNENVHQNIVLCGRLCENESGCDAINFAPDGSCTTGKYDAFYAEIERILEDLDPGHPANVYALRARLVTALLDGAAMQTRVGDRRGYLRSVTEAATAIALPDRDAGPRSR